MRLLLLVPLATLPRLLVAHIDSEQLDRDRALQDDEAVTRMLRAAVEAHYGRGI
jgi:hypothetical protein